MSRKHSRHAKKARSIFRRRRKYARATQDPKFGLEPLEPRLLLDATLLDPAGVDDTTLLDPGTGQTAIYEPIVPLSVVNGVEPTMDLTDRLNGASDGDPGLEALIGTEYDLNGGLFTNDIDIAVFGSGTGLINPFVQVAGGGGVTEHEAYNTSGKNAPPDMGSSPNFNHDLQLSEIPIVYVGGVAYYEFRLDINENDTDTERWLSFDALQIWQSATAELDEDNVFVAAGDEAPGDYTSIGFTTGIVDGNYLAYNMDQGNADNWIGMNYTLNAGSGVSDLVIMIPVASFNPDLDFVYVYSAFGYQEGTSDIYWDSNGDFIPDETLTNVTWEQGDGFEEWAVRNFAVKSGYKFHDLNADGIWDQDGADDIAGNSDDEVGLAGWTIYIDTNNDDMFDADGADNIIGTADDEPFAITDADGFYQFSLFPEEKKGATYTFREVLPADWYQSTPSGGEFVETLDLGDVSLNNNFGNYQLATKSGYKFHDLNADGVWDQDGLDDIAGNADDEVGLENWEIHLDGTNGMGGAVNETAYTDSTGYYEFNVAPGTYEVTEVLQTDWYQSYPEIPGDGDWDITLTSGQVDTDNNFGNYQLATKSGYKFHDLNADGVWDQDGLDDIAGNADDEVGLENWQINLDGTDGMGNPVSLSTTTDSNGYYEFNVAPGSYEVTEAADPGGWGWIQSYPDVLSDVGDNDAGATDGDWDIVLISQQVDAQNNFGNYLNGSIHGFKFEDMDANGLYDGTDVPMVDVWIELTGDTDGDGVIDTVQIQTGADGKFAFLDLHPGTYTVTELFTDTDASWGATVDHDGDLIGDNTTTVTLQSGEELAAFEGDAGLDPADPRTEVVVDYDLIFGNHHLSAPGLTPGFWSNHLYVWDGVEDNGPQDGQGRYHAGKLADAGVIEEPEIMDLLPGDEDVDADGKKDLMFETEGGDVLIIEWDDAQEIINQSNKKGGDKLHDFVRYAITTLLNEHGVPDFASATTQEVLWDVADWLIQYGPTTMVNGSYVLTYNNADEPDNGNSQNGPKDGFPASSRIKANSEAWQDGDFDTPAGSDIFDAMNALTHDATNNAMVTSLNGSYVFSAVNQGDYFGIRTGTRNLAADYLMTVNSSLWTL